MYRLRPIALAAAVVSLWLAPAVADEGEVAPFTLAIVRQDGILTPFATWTGKGYENNWPVPEKEVDTPITLAEIPKRWWGRTGPTLAWQVWRPGGSVTEARATEPAWFPAHCQQAMGLRTSLAVRQPTPPMRIQPYPKLGIAVSRPLDLRPIEPVETASPLRAVLAKSLAQPMSEIETGQVKRLLLDSWRHPYEDDERVKFPIQVEALYRAPADAAGSFTYYFEAVKRYPIKTQRAPASQTCEIVTFAWGSFTARPDATVVAPRNLRTKLTSCDYESVDVMLPFAYLVVKGHPVWIAQLSGWGRERYSLLDPESKDQTDDTLWSAPGGFCPIGRN